MLNLRANTNETKFGEVSNIMMERSSTDGKIQFKVLDEILEIYCNDEFLGKIKLEKDFERFFNKMKLILINKLSYIPISELDLQELAREAVKAI